MGKQKDSEELVDDLILPASSLLVSHSSDLDKEAKQYVNHVKKLLTEAGTITEVDVFYLERLKENYRVYIGIKDSIGANYSEADRFGTYKPHHLLSELRAVGDRVDSLLKEGGLTPRSRSISGIGAQGPQVPHGNAHSSDVLNIINGG